MKLFLKPQQLKGFFQTPGRQTANDVASPPVVLLVFVADSRRSFGVRTKFFFKQFENFIVCLFHGRMLEYFALENKKQLMIYRRSKKWLMI